MNPWIDQEWKTSYLWMIVWKLFPELRSWMKLILGTAQCVEKISAQLKHFQFGGFLIIWLFTSKGMFSQILYWYYCNIDIICWFKVQLPIIFWQIDGGKLRHGLWKTSFEFENLTKKAFFEGDIFPLKIDKKYSAKYFTK